MERGTVLFVGSGEDCREYIDALSDRGLKVVHSSRPEDALQWLAAEQPDVVVTDVVFANTALDAAEFIREVRARVDDAASILVLSRYVRAADRETARAAGADIFLMRPALPSALVFEVHRAFILRRGGRRLAWNWPRRLATVGAPPVVERRRSALTLSVILALACAMRVSAQQDVDRYVREHQAAIVREFMDLVAIPNVRSDLPNIKRNAELLRQMLDRRGMNAEVWDTPSTPLVYGERLVPGATRTILFYIHFDGQPVDAARWKQADPWRPIVRAGALEDGAEEIRDWSTRTTFPDTWRIYARSAGDDKGPIQAFVSAMDAIGGKPSQNVKVILHGEEEGGGPALDFVVKNHADKLRSDVLLIVDGPQHPSGNPTLYYGARGGAGLTVTVYTAKSAMHSGNYGNWLPDANVRLAQLIASMVGPTGKVAIDGFYDDVLPFPPAALKMMQEVPDDSESMRRLYGLGSTDGAAASLQEGLNLPAFSVHTLKGGEVGGVIAASATAEIAMRLVVETSPRRMIDRVVAHIRKQGYFIVDKDPDVATLAAHPRIAKVTTRGGAASGAWRTDPAVPAATFITAALRSRWGDRLVRVRTLGGGVPAGPFIDTFHVPTLGLSLANFDDNQHTDNENLRLGNLWSGIATLASIMTAK